MTFFHREATTIGVASFLIHKFFTAFFRLSLGSFCKILKMKEVCLCLYEQMTVKTSKEGHYDHSRAFDKMLW